ncbi:hypothetical protein BDR26DRAFT_862293 [Obelidium mucronatum]|nr:hypothetical protein BDR26DRAFT_862293 [Obelidium mucronatum]
MGNGGLLGRGIYFADDPRKSMGYDANATIFIFQVLLGDCLFVDNGGHIRSAVREPLKVDAQKRNKNDLFFDSIVAQPAGPAGANEYVIYNSHQCVPVYAVTYTPAAYTPGPCPIPPFAWRCSPPIPSISTWKLYAAHIFNAMSADILPDPVAKPRSKTAVILDEVLNSPPKPQTPTGPQWKCTYCPSLNDDDFLDCIRCGSEKPVQAIRPKPNSVVAVSKSVNLRQSIGSGAFVILDSDDDDDVDAAKRVTNRKPTSLTSLLDDPVLVVSDTYSPRSRKRKMPTVVIDDEDDIPTTKRKAPIIPAEAIDSILDTTDAIDLTSSPCLLPDITTTHTTSNEILSPVENMPVPQIPTKDNDLNKQEEPTNCEICTETVENMITLTQCTHKLCPTCHKTLSHTGTTMSGVSHSWIKCPYCNVVDGTEIGTCPNGTMTITPSPNLKLPGFPTTAGALIVSYDVRGPEHHLNRTTYFPDTVEGRKVVGLMKTAWDRRLCFRVGKSATTGRENTLVWNIHHKTSVSGGVLAYGYPDETYLWRVEDELKDRGVC